MKRKCIIVCAGFIFGCGDAFTMTLGTVSEAGPPSATNDRSRLPPSRNSDGGKQEDARADDGETGVSGQSDGETGARSTNDGGEAGCPSTSIQVAAAPECAPAGGYTIPDHIEVVAIVSNGTGSANSCSWQTTPISCRCNYTCGCVAPSWPSTCTCRVVGGLVVVTCR